MPRSRCAIDRPCAAGQWEWAEMSGKGKIWSFVEFYQRYHKGWENELPYNVAYVLIDEGLGLITNLVNVAYLTGFESIWYPPRAPVGALSSAWLTDLVRSFPAAILW